MEEGVDTLCFLTQPKEGKQQIKKKKTKNNKNSQKIELYGSWTTKKLKQKHSSRLAGAEEAGSQGGWD